MGKNLKLLNSDWLESLPLDKFQDKLIDVLNSVPENLKTLLLGIVSTVTNIGSLIFMIPFILFYFLKDDKYFLSNVVSLYPQKYRDSADKIIHDVDTTLSSYITGQMLIALLSYNDVCWLSDNWNKILPAIRGHICHDKFVNSILDRL